MTRSKFSPKVVLLATAIGLSVAFVGSQPAAAQSYTCPAGFAYDPSYGCTLGGDYGDYGDYGYPTVLYGRHPGHGLGHMGIGADGSIVHHGMGFHHSIVGVGHFGGGGFGHGMSDVGHGVGFAHAGGFGHGMAGGFHGGGFGGGGHR